MTRKTWVTMFALAAIVCGQHTRWTTRNSPINNIHRNEDP